MESHSKFHGSSHHQPVDHFVKKPMDFHNDSMSLSDTTPDVDPTWPAGPAAVKIPAWLAAMSEQLHQKIHWLFVDHLLSPWNWSKNKHFHFSFKFQSHILSCFYIAWNIPWTSDVHGEKISKSPVCPMLSHMGLPWFHPAHSHKMGCLQTLAKLCFSSLGEVWFMVDTLW